jgi:peptide/nickel transport system substrate-binding protein
MFIIDGDTRQAYPPFTNQFKLKWFREPKFRQAISHAIDRRRIIDTVYTNDAEEALGFVSPADLQWANTNIPVYHYDLSTARKLLSEIGMTNGLDGTLYDSSNHEVGFTLSYGTGNLARALTSKLISEDLARVGIRVDLRAIDFDDLDSELYYNHGFECAIFLLNKNDNLPFNDCLRTSSSAHFFRSARPTVWEKQIDNLLDVQLGTMDSTIQKKQWDDIQMIMAEKLPMIYTVSRYTYGLTWPGLANLRPSNATARHLTWNLEELYFKQRPTRDSYDLALR